MEENLFNALSIAISSDSYIASDGYTIYVTLSGVTSLPLLTSDPYGTTEFYLYLNGSAILYKPGKVQNPSGDAVQKSTIVLKTYVRIRSTDTVQIKFLSDSNLT